MKNKLCRMLLSGMGIVLIVAFTACDSEIYSTEPTLTEEPETVITLTAAPTATTVPTQEPTAVPKMEDTFEESILTEEFFSNGWMNLRFTSQPGFEFGTGDGIEMYARCGEDAMVEVYTEILAEGDQNLTEEEYIPVLFEKVLSGDENAKIVQQRDMDKFSINGDEFTWVQSLLEDGKGELFYRDYMVRKKESRMIVITIERNYSGASLQTATNFIRCFGAYDDPPVYLPEEWLASGLFEKGTFTENGYENEWLDLRILLPEDVIMTEVESDILDSVYAEVEWETNLPYAQLLIEYAYNQTAEDYLTDRMELLQSEALSRKEEGFEFLVDEQIKSELLGDQEYIVIKSLLRRPESNDRYQEFYCRVQDNYIVYFVFLYDTDTEEKIKEFKDLFTTY